MGTLINVIAISLGTALGLLFANRFSERFRETAQSALGIVTAMLGVHFFLKSENSIIPLIGLVVGIFIGETINIEKYIESFGGWLQIKYATVRKTNVSDDRQRFIQAFMTATMLFCVGPMAILGSIQDGTGQGCQILVVKSILDGIQSIAFSVTLGIGSGFSVIPLAIYQGLLTLFASSADKILNTSMMTEMTSAGGVMLAAIGISSLLEIKKIRVSNMLPALIITPIAAWIAGMLG